MDDHDLDALLDLEGDAADDDAWGDEEENEGERKRGQGRLHCARRAGDGRACGGRPPSPLKHTHRARVTSYG
jgi:hypothetical protein